MRLEFFGKVANNEVQIWGNEKVASQIARAFNGENIRMTVEKKRKRRSTDQNNYYWACVVPMIKERVNELGNDFDSEEIHDYLKATFNKREDDYLGIPRSTTRLTTMEFNEYLDRIKIWAADFLGVNIPDPESQMKMEL